MPLVFPIEAGLLVILAAIGSIILLRTETLWLRPLVQALQHPTGAWWKRLALKAIGAVASATLFVERHVRLALSHFAIGTLALLARFFHGIASALHFTYREIGAIADDVADALGYLRHHTIPHLIHSALAPLERYARGIDRLAHRVEHRLAVFARGIDRLLHERVLPGLRHAERRITGILTHDLPAIRRREAALEREVYGDIRARLGRIEKALGLGIFAALIYRTLARVAPWLFCRNVKRLGNVACGLNPTTLSALEALLLGTLAIENLEALARFTAAVEEELAHEVKDLLGA